MRHPQPPTAYRARVAPGLIAGMVALALVPIVGALAWLAWQWQALAPAVQSTLRVLLFGAPIALAISGGYVLLTIAWRRWADRQMIEADKVVALTKAQRALPDALTNLSYSYHDSHKALPVAEPESPMPPQLLPPPVPTFGQLLDQGALGPGKPLCLGYDAAGQPLTGSWNDLYSCGVGGMTGSGKSWLIAFLAGQSAAAGARIILVDPHAGDPESLSTRLAGLAPSFMCDVASTPTDITSALKLAASKLDNRKAGRGGTWPILLICDEWTSLLRGQLESVLTATALDIAEQGRKFGVFAILAAQAWQVAAAGQVRDRLASHYVLRTRGDQFRYQTGLRTAAAPDDTLTLQSGQAYFLSVRGDLTRVQIPLMTPADIARLGELIDKPGAVALPPFGFRPSVLPPTLPLTPSAVTSGRQDGDTAVTAPLPVTTASGSAKPISPDAARALALLHEGNDLPAIVRIMRGVAPREGRRYMVALTEVTDLLRQATKPGE